MCNVGDCLKQADSKTESSYVYKYELSVLRSAYIKQKPVFIATFTSYFLRE